MAPVGSFFGFEDREVVNMKKVWEWLDGKKMYLVAAATIIYGIYKNDIQIILEGLAIIGLKSALVKLE